MFRPRRVWTLVNQQRITRIYDSAERAAQHGDPIDSVLIPRAMWRAIQRLAHRWLAYRDMGLVPGPLGQVTWEDVLQAEGPARRAFELAGNPPVRIEPAETPASKDKLLRDLVEDRIALQAEVAQLRKELRDIKGRKPRVLPEHPPVAARPAQPPADIRMTLAYRDAGVWQGQDPVHAFRSGLEYAAKFFNQLHHASTR